jgi:hypothetical protein
LPKRLARQVRGVLPVPPGVIYNANLELPWIGKCTSAQLFVINRILQNPDKSWEQVALECGVRTATLRKWWHEDAEFKAAFVKLVLLKTDVGLRANELREIGRVAYTKVIEALSRPDVPIDTVISTYFRSEELLAKLRGDYVKRAKTETNINIRDDSIRSELEALEATVTDPAVLGTLAEGKEVTIR